MAREPATASLLDRLLGAASAATPAEQIAAVQRDVSALLRERRPWRSLPAGLEASIAGFGLRDFSAGAFHTREQREALRKEVEDAVRRFEPRLANVVVSLIDPPGSLQPVLRLRIAGTLRVGGTPVSFSTLLDSTTSDLIVQAGADV